MEFEDLIKKYPDGIHHKTTHAECVKLESLLSSSNLVKQKTRLPKLAAFLVSALLHSEEQTMTTAVNNIRTCVPYIQDYLQALILQELTKIQANMKECLEKSGNPTRALLVWRTVVYALGSALHKNRAAVNTLLVIPEKAFKSSNPTVQKNAFLSWKELIDNFALNPEILAHAKRVKLILQPLMSNKSKVEDVHLARATTWWYIAFKLQDKLSVEFEKVCIPLLRFVFQLPSESGKVTNSGTEGDQCSRALLLKGCEILLRILELNGDNFPAGLTSPKKMPSITAASLTVPVNHLTIAKNVSLILEVTKKALLFLNSLQPGCPLAQALIQMLLIRINQLSKEKVQIEVDAVAECIQFIHICVKENLVQSGLKLIDNVTRLLSSHVLTSHCYHRASNSTEVMNGVPALGFLEILLNDMVFATGNSQRFMSVFNRLVNAGVEETDFYLSFAQSVLDRLKNLCSQGDCLSSENVDIIVNMWIQTSNALWRKIQKTQEVNQGDSLEHNFSCLLSALTLPMKLQMGSQKMLQNKEVDKSWSNLCKAFMRCAALVTVSEANVACEELCSQVLQLLEQDKSSHHVVVRWISGALGVLLETLDFQSVNTMQKAMLQSPERWRKRQQQSLGNLTSLVKLLASTLSTSLELQTKGTLESGHFEHCTSLCLQHCKMLFSSVTLSSALVSLVTLLGPSLVPYYCKSSETKKSSSSNKMLEQTWFSIVTAFLLHYKGPHSQDTFDVLYPLLEPTLLHPLKSIQDKARSLWISAFLDIYSMLTFPESFRSVLKEVRPALIPGSQISSADTIASFDQSLEEKEAPKSPNTHKKNTFPPVIEVQDSPKKEKFITPKSTRKGSTKKEKKISKDKEFVVIPPSNKSPKRVLTEHQKEVLKQKSPIPALYSDLTQDTQETQLSEDTQNEDSVSIDNTSKLESSLPSTLLDNEEMKSRDEPKDEVSVIDITSSEIANSQTSPVPITSSGSATIELPTTVDLGSAPLLSESEEISQSEQNSSPDHNFDDSQLSGTDSPIVLPNGISSRDIRLPRIVKRDEKLKNKSAEIVLVRVSSESPIKVGPGSFSPNEHSKPKASVVEMESLNQATRRSKRKVSKKKNYENTPVTEHKDKENLDIVEITPLTRKDWEAEKIAETVPATRRRTKEVLAETPRRANSEKKAKSSKRKGQSTDVESAKKKSKQSEQDSQNENIESCQMVIDLDNEQTTSVNRETNSSTQELLTQIGAKSDSSSIEVVDVPETESKGIETVDIIESVIDEHMDFNEDMSEVAQEEMQEECVPEAQDVVPSLQEGGDDLEAAMQDGDQAEELEDVVTGEENVEDKELVETEEPIADNLEDNFEEVAEVEAQEQNEEITSKNDENVLDAEDEADQTEDVRVDEQKESEMRAANSEDHASQNIQEFLTEELPVSQTSPGTRKRKASSPIRSSSNRTMMTVGVGSRWKVKNSPNKMPEAEESTKSMRRRRQNQTIAEEEEKQEVCSKFTKDEKENTSIISNEVRVVLDSSVIVTAGKLKQSPVPVNKRKSLCSSSSPMSRSQRMLEAAMKARTSDNEPAQQKTSTAMHSPPSRNEQYVYSPTASPSSSILKVKTQVSDKPSSPQNGQKRRVSFADPPVKENSDTANTFSNSTGNENLHGDYEAIFEEPEQADSMKSTLTEQDMETGAELVDVDSQSPVYAELMGCTDSVQVVLSQITSSLWSRGLEKLLCSKNINTVGDLSALTCPEVASLPIVMPKVKTLRSALSKYHQKIQSRDAKPNSQLPFLEENMELEEEIDEEPFQSEADEGNMELKGASAEEDPLASTQDLWITQVPSHECPTTLDEEEPEIEENNCSPPLQSLEDVLNDNSVLQTSMLEPNNDFSSFLLNEKLVSEEDHVQEQPVSTVIDDITSAVSEPCEVPNRIDDTEEIEDLHPVVDKSFTTTVKNFVKDMTTKELFDTVFIVQSILRKKML